MLPLRANPEERKHRPWLECACPVLPPTYGCVSLTFLGCVNLEEDVAGRPVLSWVNRHRPRRGQKGAGETDTWLQVSLLLVSCGSGFMVEVMVIFLIVQQSPQVYLGSECRNYVQ